MPAFCPRLEPGTVYHQTATFDAGHVTRRHTTHTYTVSVGETKRKASFGCPTSADYGE